MKPGSPASSSMVPSGGIASRLSAVCGGASFFAALLVFFSIGYFQNTRPGWNVNSQFALTCAIVEGHTLSIDAYHLDPAFETNDKALFEGHFYSDKSPVTPFLGVPAFAAYRAWCRFADIDLDYAQARYWTSWFSIGLCAAVLTILTALLLGRAGVPESIAAAIGGLWVMATPLLGYGILFYNYVPAAALALGGFLLVQPALSRDWGRGEVSSASAGILSCLVGGLLLGLASWTLQTYALLALLMTIPLAWRALNGSLDEDSTRGRLWFRLGAWVLGGMIGAAGYAAYSYAIFGRVTSPYRYEFDEHFREMMSHGLMGAGLPSLKVLQLITVHPYKGLFILFPLTLAAVLGTVALLRRRDMRSTGALALLFFLGLLLYNAGYYMWWGGWAYAPRHLIPGLTLLSAGLAPWISAPSGRLRHGSLLLLFLIAFGGAATNVAVVSLDPQLPPALEENQLISPESVADWPQPYFAALHYVSQGANDASWGTGLGLSGFASLYPLAALWLIGVALLLLAPEAPWNTLSLLLLFLIAGGALRFAHLDRVPPGLWFDEALNAQDALKACLTGQFHLVYTDVFPREPMFETILALAMKAGGTSVVYLRGVSACIGTLTILALFGWLSFAGERSAAWIGAGALAVLRWHVIMSKLLFRTLLLPLWIIFVVWTAFAMRKNPSWTRATLLGALIGGGFYTYLAWYFMLPGVMALSIWALWPILRRSGRRLMVFGTLAACAATAGPLLLDYAANPDHIASRPKAVSLGDGSGWDGVAREIGKNFVDALGMFHHAGDHVPIVNIPHAPALDPVMGILFLMGLAAAMMGAWRRRPLEIVLLGWLVLGICPTIFTKTDSPNFLRTLVAAPAVAGLVGLGIARPLEFLERRVAGTRGRLWLRMGGAAVALSILAFSAIWTTRDVFDRWGRDERVWLGFNAVESQIGQAARSAPPGMPIWIPGKIGEHRTVRFLTSQLKTVHFYSDFAFLRSSERAESPRRVVVTTHNRLGPILRELVPTGKYVSFVTLPGNQVYAGVFEIPAGALPSPAAVDRAEAGRPVQDIGW